MNEMTEIVTVEQAERAIRWAAMGLPAAGLLVGALVGALRRRLAQGLGAGLLFGAAGPAVWVLWRMYNGIVGHFGLDSVAGLLINLALFAAIGVACGLAVGAAWRGLGKRRAQGRAARVPPE